MKITLQGEDAIRLEVTPGPLTVEAESADQQYGSFHMLASAWAFCTFSVLYTWAENAKLQGDDIVITVRWSFAENPHRVGTMALEFSWPSLPERRLEAARRAAELCAVHQTLSHPPALEITARR